MPASMPSGSGGSATGAASVAGEPLFTCAVCGANIVGHSKGDRAAHDCSRYRYRESTACSNSVLVPKDYIEHEILELIRARYTEERVGELVKLANERAAEDTKTLRNAITAVKQRLATLERQLKNVRMALREGSLRAIAAEEIESIQAERATAQAELKALENALADLKPYSPDDVKAVISRFHELAARATPEELKQCVRHFVRRLVLDPEKNEVLVEFIEDPFANGARLKTISNKQPSECQGVIWVVSEGRHTY